IGMASTARADLQSLYDDARLVKRGSYSAKSFSVLQSSIAATQTILGNADATDHELGQALASLQGALDGLEIGEDGYRLLQAEAYDEWSGGTLKTEGGGTGTNVGGTSPGSWLAYRELDFSSA